MIYVHVIQHDNRVKPWIARITGAHPRYGYARQFVRPRKDYRDTHRACSGRVTGIQSCFLLEEGWVCEVQELRNAYDRSPKRYFARVTADGLERMREDEVISWLRKRH